MVNSSRKRLRRATIIYWMLLSYIIAALVWWFISLEQQNLRMTNFRYQLLEEKKFHLSTELYAREAARIESAEKRNTTKYIAEGITFLILILIGASFVYRSVRRQFRMQLQQQNFMMAVTHELKTP